MLVLHAWWGLTDFFRNFCARLAQEGFVALAPDLYSGKTARTIEEAERLRGTLKQKPAASKILSAFEDLQQLPAVTANGLGVVGFSLGAYWALWLAQQKPEAIRAVTVFYGARGGDYRGSKAAYLGHFAETDLYESITAVKELEQKLRGANRPTNFYVYPGTGHWFFEEDRKDAYNEEAARLAWERTVAFFRDRLEEGG